MKAIIIFITMLLFMGCNNFRYLDAEEQNNGVTIQSNNHVYRLILKVKAEAKCETKISINLRQEVVQFPVSTTLDTILRLDWYSEPLFIKANYDSCISRTPRIGVALIEF